MSKLITREDAAIARAVFLRMGLGYYPAAARTARAFAERDYDRTLLCVLRPISLASEKRRKAQQIIHACAGLPAADCPTFT